MRKNWSLCLEAMAIAGLLLGACSIAAAQGGQSSQSGQGGQRQPPAPPPDKSRTPDVTPLTLDAAPPVNADEDAAFKAFQTLLLTDPKKIETGEAFLQKYPESRYRSPVYGALVYAYVQAGQVQKMQEYGEKEIALVPNDVTTLALMAQTLPRSIRTSTTPAEAAQLLAKAEQY